MRPNALTRFKFEGAPSFTAAFLALAFFWTLALSASPQLHARIHADAGHPEHMCAATLIGSGNCEDTTAQPSLPVESPVFVVVVVLPVDVDVSQFQGAALLEHAPPAHS
jgi:hypothetical protein